MNLKMVLIATAVVGTFLGSNQASAAKFSGNNVGSIEDVKCYSTFEGRTREIVTTTKKNRDSDGYVNELQLKAIWTDENDRPHFAFFDVQYARYESGNLLIVGRSPGGNALELNIDMTGGATPMSSDILINGKSQTYLKFTCSALLAG